jgi:hypothetical protein
MTGEVTREAKRMSDWLRRCADRIDEKAESGAEYALARNVLGLNKRPCTNLDTALEILGVLREVQFNLHIDALVRRAADADQYDRDHPEEG